LILEVRQLAGKPTYEELEQQVRQLEQVEIDRKADRGTHKIPILRYGAILGRHCHRRHGRKPDTRQPGLDRDARLESFTFRN